jgi:hypothetical protein
MVASAGAEKVPEPATVKLSNINSGLNVALIDLASDLRSKAFFMPSISALSWDTNVP